MKNLKAEVLGNQKALPYGTIITIKRSLISLETPFLESIATTLAVEQACKFSGPNGVLKVHIIELNQGRMIAVARITANAGETAQTMNLVQMHQTPVFISGGSNFGNLMYCGVAAKEPGVKKSAPLIELSLKNAETELVHGTFPALEHGIYALTFNGLTIALELDSFRVETDKKGKLGILKFRSAVKLGKSSYGKEERQECIFRQSEKNRVSRIPITLFDETGIKINIACAGTYLNFSKTLQRAYGAIPVKFDL